MNRNILTRTNVLVCFIIVVGFLVTAALGYRANYSASLQNIKQVSDLTSEGIYYQMITTLTKPVNISLTMANDSFLRDFLVIEEDHPDDVEYINTLKKYLYTYRQKYGYDSVFLVSTATGRYYNFNGLDRVLTRGNPENDWYYALLDNTDEYSMNVDNDEAGNNEITVFVNCKIRASDGNTLGIVGVGVHIEGLQSLLRSYEREFGVNAFLIDDTGEIEISTEHSGYEKVSLFENQVYDETVGREILSWKSETETYNVWTPKSGAQNYIVSRYIPELQWHLVVNQDTGEIMEQIRRQMIQSIAIIIIITSVVILVITRVIRSFNRQIISLTQTVEQERRTIFERATEQLFENIYELDITHNRPANQATEKYFESLGAPSGTAYDKALRIVAEKQIKDEFRQGYIDTFAPENVLRAYEDGRDTLCYDFMISNDGQNYYWMRITAQIVHWENDDSIHMLTYRQNIDAEKRQERKLQDLAQTDEMTGMLTKTATKRRIERTLLEGQGKSYAFFIFDIDNFKQTNDRFGHSFGDGVIREFTQIIRRNFRSEDVLGRIGGDEFVAFVSVPDEQSAERKAAELSLALNNVYSEDGKSWSISASIGVALCPAHGNDYESLYRKADIALYKTKEHGKNGYTVYEETESQL